MGEALAAKAVHKQANKAWWTHLARAFYIWSPMATLTWHPNMTTPPNMGALGASVVDLVASGDVSHLPPLVGVAVDRVGR
eukprot:3392780-Prymnesium_polylepis.1